MTNYASSRKKKEFSLQLTILSSEIVKSSLSESAQIAISFSASELPKFNGSLYVANKIQDVGPIGFMKRENKRPVINAMISVSDSIFSELFTLLQNTPPRSASLYLRTGDTKNFVNLDTKNHDGFEVLEVYDLGWRYPLV
jgi:hypothetical protein